MQPTPPPLPPAPAIWLLVWVEITSEAGEEPEQVRWANNPGLPHWQLVGLIESARRAVDAW